MHPILNSQMTAFAKENDIKAEEFEKFEIYSIFSLLNGRYGNNIPPSSGHLKGSEFGIDGVAIFVNGEIVESPTAFETIDRVYTSEIHFIQSKISNSFDYGEFAKLLDGVSNFIDGKNRNSTQELSDFGDIYDALYASSSK